MRLKKIICMLLCLAVCLCAVSCASGSESDEKKKIAVIVKSVDSDFWHSFQNGVDAAAVEYNVSVTFEGAENEEDYTAQNELINKAVENGADAIVLSAANYTGTVQAVENAAKRGVKIVTADSGTNSDKVSLFIGTDNYKAGEEAARAAVAGFSEGEKIKIGLVNLAVGTDNGTQREKGFRDYIDKVPSAAVTAGISADSNLESATAAAKKLMIENPDINVIVGFNEWMALGVGYAVRQLGASDRVRTVGFDSNVVSISMLETGEMQALIVQNPFAMGYLSVKYAARLTRGEAPEAAEIYTDVATVTKENMFDGDIQKLLFSFK